MSRSEHGSKCGRGCGICADRSATRRAREDEAARIDEREDPDPRDTLHIDAALERADAPAMMSPQCDRERCATWRVCAPCFRKFVEAEQRAPYRSLDDEDPWLTPEEAASLLNVSCDYLMRTIGVDGTLLSVGAADGLRYKLTDTLAYKEKRDRERDEALTELVRLTEEWGGYE